jgi:hypothetical protein
MAKKPQKLQPLTLSEIILRGDAETIRQALEARTQIDALLEEREAAYQRIAELETQVCEIVGEDGIFPFPEPPMPVADYVKTPAPKKPTPKPAAVAPVAKKDSAPADEAKKDASTVSTEGKSADAPTKVSDESTPADGKAADKDA